MTHNKVLLVLIDGLGSDYFAANRSRLPYLDALADQGALATAVRPAVPGTSRPSRATILTGVTAREHGVYGNAILDGTRFRPAAPEDIRVDTIARLARDAGRDVVGLGFGMLGAGDTSAHVAPWWQHVPTAGMTTLKSPRSGRADIDIVRHDPDGRIARSLGDAPLTLSAQRTDATRLHADVVGMASDQRMLRLAGDLACGPRPPDLIMTEFSSTDIIAHRHGLASEVTRWAFAEADMAIGLLWHRLARAGRLDDYLLVICSDHGHAPIETALYPAAFVRHDGWACEGATLHVLIEDADRHKDLATQLAEHGVRRLDDGHLPEDLRNRLATYVAPARTGFERAPTASDRTSGAPTVISTHGLDPNDPADRTLVIAHGPNADTLSADGLEDIAPHLLHCLALDAEAEALFTPTATA